MKLMYVNNEVIIDDIIDDIIPRYYECIYFLSKFESIHK